jgi:hypothetical protein
MDVSENYKFIAWVPVLSWIVITKKDRPSLALHNAERRYRGGQRPHEAIPTQSMRRISQSPAADAIRAHRHS